jgi:hypothetical protein
MAAVSTPTRSSFVIVLVVLAACSIGAPSTFAVNGASVDSAYTCPFGSDNAPYAVHGIIEVRNGTSAAVSIKSVSAVMTLAAVHGSWLEPAGSRYEAAEVNFTPTTVSAGSSTSLRVTIPSSCTNGKAPGTGTSYGEYSVALTITTSTGTYRVVSGNRHRIIPA